MTTYFVFSDEVGEYQSKPFIPLRPKQRFFIRSAVLIQDSDWRSLKDEVKRIKRYYRISLDKEVKWSHCWSAISCKRGKTAIARSKDFWYLDAFDEKEIITLIEKYLELIAGCPSAAVYYVCSRNGYTRHSSDDIERWHIQELMQRAHMEISGREHGALGVVFFDPINASVERRLREIYYRRHKAGDFVTYRNLVDSLNFQDSHHSVGIQLSDFAAGCFANALKGHRESITLFNTYIEKKLRRDSKTGIVKGYGIRSVPRGCIDGDLAAHLPAIS